MGQVVVVDAESAPDTSRGRGDPFFSRDHHVGSRWSVCGFVWRRGRAIGECAPRA